MSDVILVTGGARSGKSAYALKLAGNMPAPRTYIATCPVIDEEMKKRVEGHRREREGKGFSTIEETTNLAGALKRAAGHGVALVDCVTLWVNNLMYEAEKSGKTFTEKDAAQEAEKMLAAIRDINTTMIFVTNEVGMGVIPDNEASRRFVDAAGRVNQIIADAADEVIFMVSGVPLGVKKKG